MLYNNVYIMCGVTVVNKKRKHEKRSTLNFRLSSTTFSFPRVLNTFLAWNVFVALLCGFRVRHVVCAFILWVAVIGLSNNLINLMIMIMFSWTRIIDSATFTSPVYVPPREESSEKERGLFSRTVVGNRAWPNGLWLASFSRPVWFITLERVVYWD